MTRKLRKNRNIFVQSRVFTIGLNIERARVVPSIFKHQEPIVQSCFGVNPGLKFNPLF